MLNTTDDGVLLLLWCSVHSRQCGNCLKFVFRLCFNNLTLIVFQQMCIDYVLTLLYWLCFNNLIFSTFTKTTTWHFFPFSCSPVSSGFFFLSLCCFHNITALWARLVPGYWMLYKSTNIIIIISSVQFKMVSMRSENPIRAPAHLSVTGRMWNPE